MPAGPGYRWVVLAVGTAAQASTAAFFLGLAAVTPALRDYYDLGLGGVGVLLGVTSVGLVSTLIAWGAATDRFGERGVMTVGLAGAAACLLGAALVRDPVAVGTLLFAAGACGASVNAASGRAVLTWFPGTQRGLAMAVRQTSVPVGAAVAAVGLPAVAVFAGVPGVFVALAGGCALSAVAVAVWVRDTPRDRATLRRKVPGSGRATLTDRRLWRLSLASGLLVIPQFLGSVFLVEMLHTGHGVAMATASGLLALTQVLGAAGRIGAGAWSDRVGSRLGPLRIIALVIVVGFGLSAALTAASAAVLAAVLVPAAAVAICWNGLAFTAAGEMAAPERVGTAMAFQNTANYVSAAVTPAVGGAVAELAGYPAMLSVGAAAALLSWWVLRGPHPARWSPSTWLQNTLIRS